MTKTIILNRSKCRTFALFSLVIAATFVFEVRGDVSEKLVRDIRTLESLRTNQTPAQSKLATCFRVRLAKARGDVSSYPEKMRETRSQEGAELLECEIQVSAVSDDLRRFVVGCGGEVVSSSVRWKIMHVRLPLSALESVAEREDVLAVRRAAGSFKKKVNTSRGDTAHKAASARQFYGVSGRGVKIGVISDSVRYMSDVQASGDLPPSVDVLDDGIEIFDSGEGTAMLEIVHDLAPNAGLAFCTSGGSEAQMADNIARLADVGCRIVVDDVGYYAEPTFSSGPIEVSATEFVQNGGVYATSAGNSYNADEGYNGVWEGMFAPSPGDSTLHEFSAGTSRNKLTYQKRPWISLEWNDAWSGSSNDYALYLYDADGNVVAYSDDTQSGLSGHRPQEMLHTSDLPSSCGGSFKGLSLAVRKKASADVRRIRINTFGGILAFEQGGSTYGHSCAERVLSVGAATVPSGSASFSPATAPANYSSDGPAWRFFDITGSAIAGGRMLRKPDVLGAAAVACATPGFESFSGTSAAAPHVAAIVGLMLEANPEMTPQDVFEVLTNSTFSTSGWSPSAGYGALNAEAAVSNALSRVVAGLGRLYVSTGGNDANDGLSWATAKRTIQAAINVAEEGAIIMVSNGTYAPIVSHGKAVEIRSVNGAALTVIDGSLGNNVRCADLSPSTGTILSGFTLIKGRATGTSAAGCGGGAYCGTLNCCVISNNAASWGGGTHYSTLNNCLLVGNRATCGGGAFGGSLLNCTVADNVATMRGGGVFIQESRVRNSIVWGNVAPECGDLSGDSELCECSCLEDPKFADRSGANYHLTADSPCIDAGMIVDSMLDATDIDGQPRIVGESVDIGAYEWQGVATVRPANDDFANATAISGASGFLTASSVNATKETGEPYHGISSATNSVWWKWTATSAGSMTITTEGSGFDTGLGVYTGSSVSALTKVVANDDVVSGTYWSSVTFPVAVGTTYYIAVAGYNGATGSVKLNWSFEDIALSDFTYNIVSGSAVITKYKGSGSTVVIPSSIDGYAVTALADYAFHQSTITSITLPDSLTKMGWFSLANCKNLKTIHLPANVAQFTSRQYAPFGGNTSQTAFTVASGNTHFTAVDGVLFTKDMKELISFPAGKSVERYDIPSSVTNIWGCAFDSCKYLTTVTIPEGVSTLMYCTFSGSSKLASVSLPESLRTIDYYVFQGCSSLKSLTIPAGVTCMGYNALNTSSLTKLVLLGRSGAKYAGTFDYAAEKWGASIANANIWVMPDDYDYWTAILGEGLSVIGPEEPQTYSVIYNCGTYGSGVQQSATKTQGAVLTLKGAIFTRTGYTQTGWSTSAAGSTKAYNLGASYTNDAAITLYPYWTANTYSISYALGGGTHGTTHPTSATYGTAFCVSAPTRSGYTFAGWTVTSGLNTSTAKWGTSSSPSTTISSSSTKCANGATGNVYFKNLTPTANGSVTLTANWTAVIPLSTALDNTALTFTTGGDAGWFGQSANTHDGTDAARSGAITDNQNSWMQTIVTGPGTISFWWYASCEGSTYDYLSFSVDGVQTNKIGGTSCSWTQCSYTLGAGMHTLKWNYRKDGSVNSGLDAGFVDQLTWTPGAPEPTTYQVTFVKGMGVGAVYYRLGNSGSWTLYTAPFSVEKDAVVYYYVTPMSGYAVSCSSANPVHVTITGVATINVSADPIPKTLYVAADGSDAQSGDEGAPLATIQAAIDRAPEDSVILVGPGVYAPISTGGRRIVIRGIDGPELTVIDGGWTNRCAHLGSTTNTVLEGLTLRNGAAGYWSPYDGYVRFEEDGGGAYGGTLLNCHVVGNTARSGGGCANTVLRNCKVRGNAATRYGGGAYYSSSLRNCLAADGCCFFNNMVGVIEHNGLAAGSALYVDFASQVKVRNCIVAANVCDRYGDGGAVVAYYGTDGCALQNCTVVNNRGGMSGGDRAVGVSGFSLVNSIIRFNYDDAGRESDIPEFGSRLTISSCCVSALPRSGYTGSGNTTADPKFVDLERQVYRLQAGSPCLNSGSAVTDAGATDAMGRARIAENRIDMGACEGVASGAVVTSEVVGDGLVLEPGDVLAPNESIVFTAVETRRRFVNFTASNGAMTTDKVIRLSNVATDTTVVATFERVTFYVDAARPDDLGDGLSCGTAKKTIPAALALCARSDEVIVADGTYGAFTIPVEDVTVRSVNGPERTVIDAGGKRRCVDFSTPDGGEIVAALEGFTLCNGQTAYAGGGAYGGILKRCIVRDNVAGTAGGGLYGCRAENTIIVRNAAETFGGGAAYSTLVSCSVAGNRTNGEKGGGLYYGQAVNSVVWGNEANGTTDEYSGGSFTNCVTSPLPSGAGNRSNDPRLVDAVNGDVRLRTGSPLKDAGNPSFVAGTLDVYGNARVQGSAVDIGAIEGNEVSGHVISVRVKGVGEVTPRTAVVSDGGSVTLTAVETSRPFSHYSLYGLRFTGREQELTDLMSDLTVTAVFTPYTFYVDATAKASGDGLSWAAAKRTIQEAVDVAEVDETVRVAPGTYSPISTHNKRIVIESEKGPAVTVIDGGRTNRCATLADNSSGHATVLRGFTLTHGVLKGTDLYGGGAYAGTLDRCIVSNCQLLGTSSSSWGQGAGLAYSKAVNTLIVNNIASNYHSYAGTYYADLKNCTVTGNRAVDGLLQYGGTYYGTADNCIIWGNEGGDRNNSYGTALKYSCVDSSSTSRGTGCVVADPQFVDAANGDYRLAIGSPCIGAGILGDVGVGEVDLDGLARIVNGTIDIGAYEWQNGVVIPRSSEAAVVIPLDWFSTGKIGGLSVFSPSHFAALFGTDYAIAAKKPTGKVDAHGNPMYVWQDFVAGTDPTDKTSEFKASISFVDGKPVITWTPDLNDGGAKSLRTYRTLGIDDLSQSADPAAWHEVTPGNESAYRFFKVEVDMK